MAVNRNDFAVEGGVRTISLHNIRYEYAWEGDELWQSGDGRRRLVGCVAAIPGSPRWKAAAEGYPVMTFPDERTARVVVEFGVKRYLERMTEFT